MTIAEQLHGSRTHREDFDPNCPKCLRGEGMDGIIRHLEYCATQNESDVKAGAGWERPQGTHGAQAVAAEQRRMIGILKLYRKEVARG